MASSRKSNLADNVAGHLAPHLPKHSHILIGLSGGVDSVVLLHLLHSIASRFEWRLSALHVHHGISRHADVWADFCAGLCARLAIPLHIEHVDITPLRDEHGIEAAARKLRHAAFAAQACDFVALAHHADDQVETLLLQLLRGTGVRGAAAMAFIKQEKGRAVVRPLLDSPRSVLLAYAQQKGLHWIEDESNADDSYPRNFLRHRLLPLLAQRFPAYRETLTRGARHFAEASELLDDLARQDGAPAADAGCLPIARLRALPLPRAKNLLRYFLQIQGTSMPQAAQLEDMLRQLCDAREDAAVCVEFGAWQVRRYQDMAYVLCPVADFDRDLVLAWRGEGELQWPALPARVLFKPAQGQGISLAKLQRAPVSLRLRKGGEALRPHPDAATRSLKNLLQEKQMPPWQRERLPLLYCGDELVCVVGVAITADFQATDSEPGVVVEQSPCGDRADKAC